jgi:hypothetical protein
LHKTQIGAFHGAMEDLAAIEQQRNQPVPALYFNGFAIAVGNSDFTLQLKLENNDIAVLKCSYTVAKTLAIKLSDVVDRFEKATEYDLLTTEQVAESLKRFEAHKDVSGGK